jgi:acetyltransferase-like isoleucine patch superfamily enzyme
MRLKWLFQKFKLRYGSQETVTRTLRELGVQVCEGCRIYTQNFGTEPWLIKLGNRVCISPDVTFATHGLNFPFQEKYKSLTYFGPIEIKDNVQIGINVTILPYVTIGPNSVVGAGSVVTKDIPPDSVAAGNPARVLCTMDEYEKKCVAMHIDIPNDAEAARKVLEEHFWGKKT